MNIKRSIFNKFKSILSNIKEKPRKNITLFLSGIFLIWFALSLPDSLFDDPSCTVLNDRSGQLLAAQIACDGQWRFPKNDSVPYKFKKSILYFEDQYFYKHPGINPFSIARALKQNIVAGKIVSGGSTITSQVIRMSRKGKKRTVYEKIVESILALRLELKFKKEEILAMYASYAPFGGNVVGLDAAAWRYYGRAPDKLSWGETATLAVLPNAPSLIYPGKNHKILLAKRNRLLDKLFKNKEIDSITCELAKLEPLPGKPKPIPQYTPHLLTRAYNEGISGKRIETTIDKNIQEKTKNIINKHHKILYQNEILNAAALILEIETGNVIAYIGNTDCIEEGSGNQVDIITAPRSTGSTLKPFLYALMLKDGEILPNTLIPDAPLHISGYNPSNFNKKYDGAVHAGNALARSLNIPAIRMLKKYGVERFHHELNKLKLTTINQHANHYGLSLILGGAETTLWDITSAYASMARVLNHYRTNHSQYAPKDYHKANFLKQKGLPIKPKNLKSNDLFGAAPIYLTFEALSIMNRPLEGTNWEIYSSSKKIAWKTGTSFGHRDAWAIGVTPGYAVGVWVGNADGEGRPGLTGASSAAPIMFEIFKTLPSSGWFDPPYDEMVKIPICRKSGHKASNICEPVDSLYIYKAGLKTTICPYHKMIHLDKNEKYRVTSECYRVSDMVTKSWFILPPVMEWYYKSVNMHYKTLPPIHPKCFENEERNMDFIYPKTFTKIFIPRGFNNTLEKIVFEVVHRIPNTTIHWHLDDEYLGSTNSMHSMELFANAGNHTITLVDETGEILSKSFEIIAK